MFRSRTAAFALAGAFALAAPSLADSRLRVDVRGDDGGRLNIELPGSWARAILDAVEPDCEPADEAAVLRAMRTLDRKGQGASVRFVDRDGDRIRASREGGVLRLEVVDADDGTEAEIEMPWRAAECWLLGREPEDGVAFLDRDEGFRFEIVSDDARIHVSID